MSRLFAQFGPSTLNPENFAVGVFPEIEVVVPPAAATVAHPQASARALRYRQMVQQQNALLTTVFIAIAAGETEWEH